LYGGYYYFGGISIGDKKKEKNLPNSKIKWRIVVKA
jgi:hypothetical protein